MAETIENQGPEKRSNGRMNQRANRDAEAGHRSARETIISCKYACIEEVATYWYVGD